MQSEIVADWVLSDWVAHALHNGVWISNCCMQNPFIVCLSLSGSIIRANRVAIFNVYYFHWRAAVGYISIRMMCDGLCFTNNSHRFWLWLSHSIARTSIISLSLSLSVFLSPIYHHLQRDVALASSRTTTLSLPSVNFTNEMYAYWYACLHSFFSLHWIFNFVELRMQRECTDSNKFDLVYVRRQINK